MQCLFELGSTAEEVYGVYEALPDTLKGLVAFGSLDFYSLLFRKDEVGTIGQGLVAARGVNDVLQFSEPITEETAQAFFDQVSAYTYASNEDVNAAASELGAALALNYLFYLFAPPNLLF